MSQRKKKGKIKVWIMTKNGEVKKDHFGEYPISAKKSMLVALPEKGEKIVPCEIILNPKKMTPEKQSGKI